MRPVNIKMNLEETKMMKWKTGVLCGLCITALLSGCGAEQEKEAVEFTTEKIDVVDSTTETMAEAKGEDITEIPERGISVTLDQEYIDKGVKLESFNYNMQDFPIQAIYYYYRPITDPILDEAFRLAEEEPEKLTAEWQADFYEKLWAHSRCLMKLTLVPEEEYQTLLDQGKSLDDLTETNEAIRNNTEEFGRNDGYVYLLSIPDYELTGLDEEEISQYEECKEYMQKVREDLKFMPLKLESNETDLGEQMPQFSALDLNGNEVTNDIFANKELTVVNVWGTFCTPCIEEMPEIGTWAKEMPDNVQIIGIVTDIEGEEDTEHLEQAKKIMEKSGAEFTQVVANEDFTDWLKGVVGVPTTFLVDQNGTIIGEPIVGAKVSEYKQAVEEYLNE